MREIKFRAWDKRNNKMIYQKSKTKDFEDLINFFNDIWFLMDCAKDKDNIVIMQFTGLKDKNGKEIFEGDILKNSYDGLFIVTWNFDSFVLKEGEIYYHFEDEEGEDYTFIKHLEVIGNIYENPELLEEKNNDK